MHSPGILDLSFKAVTFDGQVWSVAIENVGILGVNVNVLEEVIPHVKVVTLWVIPW